MTAPIKTKQKYYYRKKKQPFKPIYLDVTPEDVEMLIKTFPPLTEDDFRFSAVSQHVRAPDPKDNSIMLVMPLKSDKEYSLLSSMTHKCYIRHRIPQIPNQAPSIEQWYQELRVYRHELDINIPPKTPNSELIEYEPKTSFFYEANINFASSTNARRKKAKGQFIYYYYIDPETNEVKHLLEPQARQLYCKKYEQTILFDKSPARKVFLSLWRKCMGRSREIPIVIRGYNVLDELHWRTHISERYHDYGLAFGHEYCLAEMLINFPNIDNCIWNREEPPTYIPYRHNNRGIRGGKTVCGKMFASKSDKKATVIGRTLSDKIINDSNKNNDINDNINDNIDDNT